MRIRRTVIAIACLLSAGNLPARAEPLVLTLSGPAQYTPGQPVTGFTGRLFADADRTELGVPAQMIDVLVDGATVKKVSTDSIGRFAFNLAPFQGATGHTVQAVAYRDTPIQTTSTKLDLESVPVLSLTPPSASFGSIMFGSGESTTRSFTVSNVGGGLTGPITVTTTALDYTAVGCTGERLEGGASCAISVTFAPTALGPRPGSLRASGSLGGPSTATLSGTGTGILAQGVAFGMVTVGTTSSERSVVITNTASSSTGTIATSYSGQNISEFLLVNDGCAGVSLAAGASCSLIWRFAPASPGPKDAFVTAGASPGGTSQATMTGTGQDALLTITPQGHDFGEVPNGQSREVSFVVSNKGQITSGTVAISLTNARFSIVANDCSGRTLAYNETCSVVVRYQSYYDPFHNNDWTAVLTASASPGGTVQGGLHAVSTCDVCV